MKKIHRVNNFVQVQNIKKSYAKSVGAPARTLPARLQRPTPVKVKPTVPNYADVETVKDYRDEVAVNSNVDTTQPPPLTKEEIAERMLPENQAVLNNGAPFWTVGDLKRPATFISVEFNSHQPMSPLEPGERRTFIQFMANYHERLLREIQKALKVKPVFKARLRLHLWIASSKKDHVNMKFRGYVNIEPVYEVVLITKGHRLVNQTNYKEEYAYLINEMCERVISIVDVGSGWRLVKYFALSYDMYENKPLRSGSFIPTPENILMLNVVLLIYKIKITDVLCGA